MATFINIDGNIINLDNVKMFTWGKYKDHECLCVYSDLMDTPYFNRFYGDNAKRAYGWLMTTCLITFADDEDTETEPAKEATTPTLEDVVRVVHETGSSTFSECASMLAAKYGIDTLQVLEGFEHEYSALWEIATHKGLITNEKYSKITARGLTWLTSLSLKGVIE